MKNKTITIKKLKMAIEQIELSCLDNKKDRHFMTDKNGKMFCGCRATALKDLIEKLKI